MRMDDPVIDLMNKLVVAYDELVTAQKRHGDDAVQKLRTVTTLREMLHVTEPTTPAGAAHLLREAAGLMLRSKASYYGDILHRIASRLGAGQRSFTDLLELRDMLLVIGNCPAGSVEEEAVQLVENALKGASRPVVVVDTPRPRGRLKPRFADNPPRPLA